MSTPTPTGQRTFNWEKIVRCVVRNCKWRVNRNLQGCSLWYAVAELCGMGSTSAIELCEHFGIDPHEKIPINETPE
jgi:hypothetical protein